MSASQMSVSLKERRMKATGLQHSEDEKVFALIFDKGDEVVRTLTEFARDQRMSAAHFTAIGAFSDVTLGFFDREAKHYQKIPLRQQVEVLSLIGDIALDGDTPKVHAHVVVGKADGTAHGGHLVDGHVWPTLELILTESPTHLRRRHDRETGLGLIDLSTAG
jgi:predicted DNA-binding protein with PD1-like motif